MCTSSKPKTVATPVVAEKDLPVLRNPWLDGSSVTNRGVSSLRIDRKRAPSGTVNRPTVTTPGVTQPTPPRPAPGVQTGDPNTDLVIDRLTGGRNSLLLSRSIL